MIAKIEHKGRMFTVDLDQPLDISITMKDGSGPRAWYLAPAVIKPVINEHFIGKVSMGGNVNFNNIEFNPHGHVTHTESVGHISKELVSVNEVIKKYFFLAQVITVVPMSIELTDGWKKEGDRIISIESLQEALGSRRPEALVIRTQPNGLEKNVTDYSRTNPVYVETAAISWLVSQGVDHLLLDVPSVDREEDGGLLLGHHAFWQYPEKTAFHRSITELIYVPDEVRDGEYLLNLQFAPFENDASPSRPLLFEIFTP